MGKLGLGPVGLALNVSDGYLAEAAEAERLGYSAIWLAGGQLDRLSRIADVVRATQRVPVGSSIISLDVYSSGQVAGLYAQLEATAPERFLPGIGGPQVSRPLQALGAFLDDLDHAVPPIPAGRRLLAALGPRKLELARDRCAGAIVLMVTPTYIGAARRALGDEAVLVIDQMLVLDGDAARARQTASGPLGFLSGLPGYRASFARMGFSEAEIDGLSDRLVDELVIWGDAATVADRIGGQLEAGADHVVLHVLGQGGQPGPIEAARALAGSLPGYGLLATPPH
jgi:probable F420-dependent oxidoreductase